MKRMNYMWKLLAGILCLWGCGEERLEGYGGGEGQVIALSGTIVQDGKSRVDDGGFCDGDVIGVYIVDYEGENAGELLSAGNRATNARFVYDEAANRWSSAYDIYWKDKETPVDVYGYYPYGEPEDVTTCVVKVELLPPPCSMCRINARSSTRASRSV